MDDYVFAGLLKQYCFLIIKIFFQSVMQDCLHLVDSINATYLWKLSEELWFQCIFLTLSFITIYTLDG